MPLFGVTITDDRGRAVPALAVRRAAREGVAGGAGDGADAPLLELRRQVDKIEQEHQSQYDLKTMVPGCVVVAFCVLLLMFVQTYVPAARVLSGPLTAIIPVFGMLYWYRWRFRRDIAKRATDAALTLLVCPSCGYSLRGLQVADDRCVECPECRAAWLSTRMGLSEGESTVSAVGIDVGRGSSNPTRWARSTFVTDARGRGVQVADPQLLGVAERLSGRDANIRVDLARQWIFPSTHEVFWSRVGLALLAAFFGGYGAYMLLHTFTGVMSTKGASPTTDWASLLGSAVMGAVLIGVALFTLARGWRYIRVPDSELIKSGLLRQGLCPSCAGDLRPVQPEADGATVCPTCRAAWLNVRQPVYGAEVGAGERTG